MKKKNELQFIWGIKSKESCAPGPASLLTLNDIEITYSLRNKQYILGVNSCYKFDTHQEEARYLLKLLDYFTEFMRENKQDMDDHYYYFEYAPRIVTASEYLSELYAMFKIFVKGYAAVYGGGERA